MKESDSKLIATLGRLKGSECPSERELGEFVGNSLAAQERQTVESHLRSCPYCINRVVEMRETALLLLEGEKAPDRLIARLQQLIPNRPQGALTPQPVLKRWFAGIAQTLGTTRDRLSDWITPRFVVEVVAASAVAIVLVMVISPGHREKTGAERQYAMAPAGAGLGSSETAVVTAFREGVTSVALSAIVAALNHPPLLSALSATRGAANDAGYANALDATVALVTDEGTVGLGSIIGAPGQVLTNWHLVKNSHGVAVMVPLKPDEGARSTASYTALVTKLDPASDLAILTIEHPPPGLKTIPKGKAGTIEPGSEVQVIGKLEGKIALIPATTAALRPDYQWLDAGVIHRTTAIEVLMEFPPEIFGGAILDSRGRLIGVYSYAQQGGGRAYAVSVEVAQTLLKQTATASQPAGGAATSSYRAQSFGPYIKGVYLKSVEPPPDIWFVYATAGSLPLYSASGRMNRLAIDTIVKPQGPGLHSLTYYFDSKCDGQIDLVGYSDNGSTIERYERPTQKVSVASLAPEMVRALRAHIIPYPKLHFCGQARR
ncbi:MAG TPA: serine protease [Candidatus Binataceae bacterium]|nr:serine protease [Candidatus Binataceae bacterium]